MTRSWEISGRVQGVGFRAFVQYWARQLGLKGWVRNTPAGTVQCFAEGPTSELDTLLTRLQTGPPGSHVMEVAPRDFPKDILAEQFEIRHDVS